jgi:hypothetical protein
VPAREPEHVDFLLAEAFNAQDLSACVALYDPEASVVWLEIFGGDDRQGRPGHRCTAASMSPAARFFNRQEPL